MNQQPFIQTREVISSTPWGGWIKSDMPQAARERYLMVYWSEDKVRLHYQMLDAFGFNSLHVSATPAMALWANTSVEAFYDQMRFRCQVARELGWTITGFVWGAAISDPTLPDETQQFRELQWHVPEERERLVDWYREQAEQLAPHIDRLNTHWIDPGQWQQDGVDTVVEMHNTVMAIWREKNPDLQGFLSCWFFDSFAGRRYPGYTDEGKLAVHPKLDKNSGVSLGRLNYSCNGYNTVGGNDGSTLADRESLVTADILDAIAAADRPAAVWCWYTADNEIQPTLHVRTRVMQNYFRNLPRQAADLAWHSLDDNFSGINTHSLYVAGKLMQDPSLDAQALLDEFCREFVGTENAPSLAAALRALEDARTRSLLYKAESADAVAPESTETGTLLPAAWLATTAKAVADAQAAMRMVTLPEGFEPPWPVAMPPAEYLAEVRAHLESTRQMLAFLAASQTIETMLEEGRGKETIADAIKALPAVRYDGTSTAGWDAATYRQKLTALKKKCE